MKLNKLFTALVVFFMLIVSATCFADDSECDGTTETACVSQTWTQNSCTGNKYCNSIGGGDITESECVKFSDLQGSPVGCNWETHQLNCVWMGACCSTGGAC